MQKVKAYDVSKRNLRRYVEEMSAKYPLEIVSVDSPRKAVEDCEIVVTAGSILIHPTPVIWSSWLKDGGFACSLDFDSYWKPDTRTFPFTLP